MDGEVATEHGGVRGREHHPGAERERSRDDEAEADEEDPDGQDHAGRRGQDQLVDDPVGRPAVEMGEVARGEGADLLRLVVVARGSRRASR